MNGILNIDKPAGLTSHDVVYRVRKIVGQKRVGHAGTLDPDATGVLLVCLGHATRLSDLLADQGKEYEAVLRLGVATSTEDASGEIVSTSDPSAVTEALLRETIERFVGDILQVPPMVSAVHHEGKRLYDLARRGITVERDARSIKIDSIELLTFDPGTKCSASIRVCCGKGTYIRTLCADMGAALGVGGHMASLRRTSVGSFRLNTAVRLEDLNVDRVSHSLISPSDAVSFLQAIQLESQEMVDILNGKRIVTERRFEQDQLVRLAYQDTLVALARIDSDGYLQPTKVFPPEPAE